ncbi:MAG: CCA tRNA nucleotidyltransferase [Methanoregulaceae archaeon]|nr:CCA tRNA nucleotidyltransferase [Methanoregulaceae archaeon]
MVSERSLLEQEVLLQIRPTPEEKEHMQKIARCLIDAIEERGITAMVVGSVARNTWVSGDRDLDIFMLYDPSVPREELEQRGLSLAREVALAFGAEYREKYAEHPYINASIGGTDVDLVPCYLLGDARALQCAVDRTPFHTRYIRERINDYIDDVLLAKQFAKAGGVYGSDQMTEGFSGYLTELLVLHYGGFIPLLRAASCWRPGTLIDPEQHQQKDFHDPLVVIDPVDPERNVSASVSLTRMYEFVELARGYLAAPSRGFFFPPQEEVYSCLEFRNELARRGTVLYAVSFDTPPYIEDIVVPQLRKSTEAIRELLARNEFVVNRTDYQMRPDRSILLFELLVDRIPPVKRHSGPPLWNRANAEKFSSKYLDDGDSRLYCGPFIDNGVYFVEIARRYTDAGELLRSRDIFDVALGRHVKISMAGHYQVDKDEACWMEENAAFISGFLQKASPCIRRKKEEHAADPGPHPFVS